MRKRIVAVEQRANAVDPSVARASDDKKKTKLETFDETSGNFLVEEVVIEKPLKVLPKSESRAQKKARQKKLKSN